MQRYSFISRTIALSLGSYAQALLLRAYERLMPVAEVSGDVLIVQLGQIGDFVLTMHLIEALKKKYGDGIRISVLIDSINLSLARDCEGIDGVYVYDSEKYSRSQKRTPFPGEALEKTPYSSALLLRGDGRTFRWLVANRVPVRSVARFPNPMRSSWISLIREPKAWPEKGMGPLKGIDKKRPRNGRDRRGKRYTHFVDALMELGGIESCKNEDLLTRSAGAASRAVPGRGKGPDGRRVFIHIGSGGVLRRWPEERFADLSGRLLQLDLTLNIALIGAKSDYERAHRIMERMKYPYSRVVNGCGAFDLSGLKAAMKSGSLYIGLDSGPMHIAASTGIPVVALMGPQSPDVFGPRGDGRRIVYKAYPCSPCWQFACVYNPGGGTGRCISDITAEEVFTEAKELLKGGTTVEKDTAPLQCLLG